ncbi:MAG: tetratricopeptide repeat protein [Planctomycetia bacterium]|nr:tetratricopeptide repeat protein [Planctomycetia bacterium]
METKSKEQWYDDCIQLHKAGKTDEAAGELEKLIKVWPDYGLAYLALAVFYEKMGKADEVMETMHTACEKEPDDPFYYTAFSALAIRAGNHSVAESALMKAQESHFAEQLKKMQEDAEEASSGSDPEKSEE